MIGLGHYLAVGAILFVLGVFGIFLNRKNVIVILMAIELSLLSVNPAQAGISLRKVTALRAETPAFAGATKRIAP